MKDGCRSTNTQEVKLQMFRSLHFMNYWKGDGKERKSVSISVSVSVNEQEKGGDWARTWRLERWNMTNLAVVHHKSFSELSIDRAHIWMIDLWQAIAVPSREGRAVVSLYRTWHRACVRGLIERQRPMRKGKKIKRGRKGKHLGVLDILSAPNTHLGAWKNTMNGIHYSVKKWAGSTFRTVDGSRDQMVDG